MGEGKRKDRGIPRYSLTGMNESLGPTSPGLFRASFVISAKRVSLGSEINRAQAGVEGIAIQTLTEAYLSGRASAAILQEGPPWHLLK